jgi:hypothetical protein
MIRQAGVKPWRASVLLDGGAIDTEATMQGRGAQAVVVRCGLRQGSLRIGGPRRRSRS